MPSVSSLLTQTDIPPVADNNVIQQIDSKQFPGFPDASGDQDILAARPWISARVVVYQNNMNRMKLQC